MPHEQRDALVTKRGARAALGQGARALTHAGARRNVLANLLQSTEHNVRARAAARAAPPPARRAPA